MRRFLYIFICIAAIFVMTIYDLYAALSLIHISEPTRRS